MYVHRAPGENSNNTLISAEIHGVPDNVTLSVGQRLDGGIVKLSEDDLSNVKMSFKGDQDDFKLKMIVSITSNPSSRKKRDVSDTTKRKRSRTFEFTVTGKGSLQPTLVTHQSTEKCFSKDVSKLEYKYSVGMARGSTEIVRLIISNLPDGFGVFGKNTSFISNTNASYVIQNASFFNSFVIEGPFKEMKKFFNFTVTASATPDYGEIRKDISVDECCKISFDIYSHF